MTSVVPIAEYQPKVCAADRRALGLPDLDDEQVVARGRRARPPSHARTLGTLTPAEYGKRREALSEELETTCPARPGIPGAPTTI